MASNMFIKFENPSITGSSDAPGHSGEIEVLSWSHGFVQPTSATRSSAGGGTVEQAAHQNFTFTKYLDRSTNEILKYSWSGRQIGKATLRCFRSEEPGGMNAVEYLTVTMEHVIISNYSVSGGPGDIPVENVSLDYGIVQYTYIHQKHSDSASVQHDLETRTVK
jgi:type VI secretion system secreted protein Hcp